MTDRLHSCKDSPNGRHRLYASKPPRLAEPGMCVYCHRTVSYLMDLGWNAPAIDPDAHLGAQEWHDEEADVTDADRASPCAHSARFLR